MIISSSSFLKRFGSLQDRCILSWSECADTGCFHLIHKTSHQRIIHSHNTKIDRFFFCQMRPVFQIPWRRSAHTLRILQSLHFPVHSTSFLLCCSLRRWLSIACSLPPLPTIKNFSWQSPLLLCDHSSSVFYRYFFHWRSDRSLPAESSILPAPSPRRCKISGVSSGCVSTAFCNRIGPVSVPSSTK